MARLSHPALAVYLMSANPEREGLRAEAVAAGCRGVIAKPVLPRALHSMLRQSTADVALAASGAQQVQQELQLPASARVLLAEDNPINRLVASEMLKLHGIDVDVAQNGIVALEMVTQGAYDLVLMDVQMPVLDGLEATRLIRAQPKFKALPIIAMTANAFDSDREGCVAAGMDGYLSKPVDPAELAAKLSMWLSRRVDRHV